METASSELPLWFFPLFPVWFIAVWCLVCIVISRLSGWHALARRSRSDSQPSWEIRSAGPLFYTVYFRFWCHYSSVIRLTTAEDALYMSVLFLFRIGHPPLRIPWSEIALNRTNRLWLRYVVLTLGTQEQIPMRISERMAGDLGLLERLPIQPVS